MKAALDNPRLCGWREINGELVRDAQGEPVAGQWEAILTPDEWRAVMTVMESRKGRQVGNGGVVGLPIPADQREHRYLMSGILRCGKPKEGGGICNTPLRPRPSKKGNKAHVYYCPGRSDGGCGGVSRSGEKIDEFISEALLASLEDKELARRKSNKPAVWTGAGELKEVRDQLDALTIQWNERKISNEHPSSHGGYEA